MKVIFDEKHNGAKAYNLVPIITFTQKYDKARLGAKLNYNSNHEFAIGLPELEKEKVRAA